MIRRLAVTFVVLAAILLWGPLDGYIAILQGGSLVQLSHFVWVSLGIAGVLGILAVALAVVAKEKV